MISTAMAEPWNGSPRRLRSLLISSYCGGGQEKLPHGHVIVCYLKDSPESNDLFHKHRSRTLQPDQGAVICDWGKGRGLPVVWMSALAGPGDLVGVFEKSDSNSRPGASFREVRELLSKVLC